VNYDYIPLNQCSLCEADFTSVEYFDQHRVGTHEYTFAEGMRMEPPREDGRRCLDEQEMAAVGLVRVKAGDSKRHEARVATGVSLYWNPLLATQLRKHHAHSRPL
jgi:hypothetical protein